MPSASLVMTTTTNAVDNSSMSGDSPLVQAVQIVEKKVRNLEKRKSKLDNYRSDYQRGKELNDDQKAAIAKYDEVLQNLDFARELSAQFKTLIQEDDKNRKKQIRKEQQERTKLEVNKVVQILELQELFKLLIKPKVWSDFTSGSNGAPSLSKDDLSGLDEFCKTVNPKHSSIADVAEHLLSVIEGKNKKVGKTNYKSLLSIVDSIKASGYLDKSDKDQDSEEQCKKKPGKPSRKEATKVTHQNGDEEKNEAVLPVSQTSAYSSPSNEGFPPPSTVEPTTNDRIKFLQDSQIDLESPHMDPAVVMVQRSPPPMMSVSNSATIPTNEQGYSMPPPTNATVTTMPDMQQQPPAPYGNFHQFEQHKLPPSGFGHLDQPPQQQQQLDTMANIDDWNSEQTAANNKGTIAVEHVDGPRPTWKSSRGSGSGNGRGRGGHPNRGYFRGGRTAHRGGGGIAAAGGGGGSGRSYRNGEGDYKPTRGRGRGSSRPANGPFNNEQ